MMLRKLLFGMLFLVVIFTTAYAQGWSTSQEELIKKGVDFYSKGKFTEAADVLQMVTASPEALYWLSLSELSLGNFDKSLSWLAVLEKNDPGGRWSAEVPYHRGRCYYYLGRHEEAIASLQRFASPLSNSDPYKASAYYWQGESFFALGQLDSAANAFYFIVEKFPRSEKYEAARYRLNTINQKKIENELLAILKWSHEESLKSLEGYQEREKNYEQLISSYQRRISELLAASGDTAAFTASTNTVSKEPSNAVSNAQPNTSAEAAEYYNSKIIASDQKIAELEERLAEVNTALRILRGDGATDLQPPVNAGRDIKLEELKLLALELKDILTIKLNEVQR